MLHPLVKHSHYFVNNQKQSVIVRSHGWFLLTILFILCGFIKVGCLQCLCSNWFFVHFHLNVCGSLCCCRFSFEFNILINWIHHLRFSFLWTLNLLFLLFISNCLLSKYHCECSCKPRKKLWKRHWIYFKDFLPQYQSYLACPNIHVIV
jgi:hypothetical protein